MRRHMRLLSWHALPYQGCLAFPGDQLARLSTDLATGAAGILLALHAARTGAPPLPLLEQFDARVAPCRREPPPAGRATSPRAPGDAPVPPVPQQTVGR